MLADGTYTYRKVTAYQGEDIIAIVEGGIVTDWQRNGLSVTFWGLNPADCAGELVAELECPQRKNGLCWPVQFTPAPAPDTIGKEAARVMHVELAHLGFRDHYAVAAEALCRPVSSLAALTAAEQNTVWSYARGQWGMV